MGDVNRIEARKGDVVIREKMRAEESEQGEDKYYQLLLRENIDDNVKRRGD